MLPGYFLIFILALFFVDEFLCKTIFKHNGTDMTISKVNRIKNCFHISPENFWIHGCCQILIINILFTVKILNSLDEDGVRAMKKQLLSIAEDGEITEDEQEKFDGIVKKLEVLATAISELRMLAEKFQR